jgi:hypothetical protein
LIIAFIAGQLYFNYRIGVVYSPGVFVSPFYLYGMYANVYKIEVDYSITEVEVNSHLLEGKDFTPQQWDKIMLPVKFYAEIKASNSLYKTEIERLMKKISIQTREINFIQSCNDTAFKNWYTSYLQNIISEKINAIEIRQRIYQYKGHHLQPTNTVLSLSQLCN